MYLHVAYVIDSFFHVFGIFQLKQFINMFLCQSTCQLHHYGKKPRHIHVSNYETNSIFLNSNILKSDLKFFSICTYWGILARHEGSLTLRIARNRIHHYCPNQRYNMHLLRNYLEEILYCVEKFHYHWKADVFVSAGTLIWGNSSPEITI